MTSDELAQAQLFWAQAQLWVTAAAIFLGPLAGVIFTIWFQNRKEKRDQKSRLFLTLMAHRKAIPPTIEAVNSLNVIDVVFADNKHVVTLWHEYYDLLSQTEVNWHLADAKFLDLIWAMARVVGCKNLSQTDISKFYTPMAHSTQTQMNQQIQVALLGMLHAVQTSAANPTSTTSKDISPKT